MQKVIDAANQFNRMANAAKILADKKMLVNAVEMSLTKEQIETIKIEFSAAKADALKAIELIEV